MAYYKQKDHSDEEVLIAHLKGNTPSGPYLIYGDDNYLKVYYANEIVKKAVNDQFPDFNLKKLQGDEVSIELIRDAVEALPMFSDKTGVLVCDLPVNDLKSADFDNLIDVIGNMSDSCALVFLMLTVEAKSESKKGDGGEGSSTVKKNNWKEFKDLISNKGHVFNLGHRMSDKLLNLLIRGARDRGKVLDKDLAGYMVETIGSDLNKLRNELDKVCNFSKDKVIERTDIDAITVKTLEANIFHLADNVLSKNSDKAFEILQILVEQKVEPIMIVATLIGPFVDLYRVKTALESGHRPTDVAKYYDYKNKEFRLTKIQAKAERIPKSKLIACLNCLDKADESLKSRPNVDDEIVLEQTIATLLNII
ncbi:MAG TPA: DNA polymerase III subunit delta [Clostridiales bacterium]|nr:DNA polymerase III subunit delta [Clostridiales bacterium]HRT82316.1 DNA polymerase III subunit delta [Oscillospiraceae bacterium]